MAKVFLSPAPLGIVKCCFLMFGVEIKRGSDYKKMF